MPALRAPLDTSELGVIPAQVTRDLHSSPSEGPAHGAEGQALLSGNRRRDKPLLVLFQDAYSEPSSALNLPPTLRGKGFPVAFVGDSHDTVNQPPIHAVIWALSSPLGLSFSTLRTSHSERPTSLATSFAGSVLLSLRICSCSSSLAASAKTRWRLWSMRDSLESS
jgi:hypothetical protein